MTGTFLLPPVRVCLANCNFGVGLTLSSSRQSAQSCVGSLADRCAPTEPSHSRANAPCAIEVKRPLATRAMSGRDGSQYFSAESGAGQRYFYYAILATSVAYSTIAMLAPLLTPECGIPIATKPGDRQLMQGLEGGLEDAPNPSYVPNPCRWTRYVILLGMSPMEAQMSRRVILSLIMGSIIGFERRRADRPAGIRTMAMVCLGSCAFTLASSYAFLDGTMGWDASRVSAAIPSGVGFLGAASIWKGTKKVENGETAPEVHGLTTATSVWLSAAIGILCGGGLYVPGLFTTCVGVVYLRFAPRLRPEDKGPDDECGRDGNDEEVGTSYRLLSDVRREAAPAAKWPSATAAAPAAAPLLTSPSAELRRDLGESSATQLTTPGKPKRQPSATLHP